MVWRVPTETLQGTYGSVGRAIAQAFFFCSVSSGGVRLGPLGTSDTNWPIVPSSDVS
jgi:hypothetical protein